MASNDTDATLDLGHVDTALGVAVKLTDDLLADLHQAGLGETPFGNAIAAAVRSLYDAQTRFANLAEVARAAGVGD